MDVKPQQAEAALRRQFASFFVVLIHGPDAGRTSELARLAASISGVPSDDPFLFIRAEADDYLSEPGRLMDEAMAISMFGGKRLIWLHLGSRNAAPAIETLLEQEQIEAHIIIEAGDLKKDNALRQLCERSGKAISIACYADESIDLGQLVESMFTDAGKRIEAEASALLVDALGADRALSRSEIGKLLLYLGEDPVATIADVEAVVIDAAKVEPFGAVDAAFGGMLNEVEPAARRVIEFGTDAGFLLGMSFRHAQTLISLLAARRENRDLKDAFRRQGLNFRREPAVLRQLTLWTEARLLTVTGQLTNAIGDVRKSAALAPSLAVRSLWSIALSARRQGD